MMKRRVCSYDMLAVPNLSVEDKTGVYLLTTVGNINYFRSSRLQDGRLDHVEWCNA